MKESPATDVDRATLDTVRKWACARGGEHPGCHRLDAAPPVQRGGRVLRGATLSGQMSQLKAQVPDAWPTCSACRGSSRRWTSSRTTGSGGGWRRRWRGFSQEWMCSWCLAPGRDAHDHELHRTPVAHLPGGLRLRCQRPGATGRPIPPPAADVQSAKEGSARGHADRAAVRRGNDRAGRAGDGTGARRERGAAAGVLRLISLRPSHPQRGPRLADGARVRRSPPLREVPCSSCSLMVCWTPMASTRISATTVHASAPASGDIGPLHAASHLLPRLQRAGRTRSGAPRHARFGACVGTSCPVRAGLRPIAISAAGCCC